MEKLNSLYKEVDELNVAVSDALKNAKRNKETEIVINRQGKVETIKEAYLWDEVRILGVEAKDAYEILSAKYPEVFDLSAKQRDKAAELSVFTEMEFGMSSTAIRLRDIIDLIEAMVEYKLETRETN